MMARSKLVLTVLGAAAVVAAAGCGSVTAGASHAGAAGGGASATASPGSTSAASSAPAKGQPNAVGGPIRGVSQPLCSAPGSASRVVITRTGKTGPLTPGGPVVAAYRSPTPAVSVVQGAAQASALAKAVCALPAMTGGVVHCPKLDTVGYQLAFTAGGRALPAVTVQPSGCQMVTGAGVVRTAASRPAFLKLLVSMAGVVRVPGAVHVPGASVGGAPLRPVTTVRA